jgi:hypothetical protein
MRITDTNTYAHSHSKRYSNSDAERDTNAKSYTHATNTPNTRASPIALASVDMKTKSNTSAYITRTTALTAVSYWPLSALHRLFICPGEMRQRIALRSGSREK